jgi:hypothetical protein
LICLTCKGAGVVSVYVEADTCERCGGTGEAGVFYSNACIRTRDRLTSADVRKGELT